MPNNAKDELQALLDKLPIQNTEDKPKHHRRTIDVDTEMAFVEKCCTSKYTEACLQLMKEGKVPFRLVKAILKKEYNSVFNALLNNLLSFFKSNISLDSLIGKYNIAILKQGNRCIALDPNDTQQINDDKIKKFFNNATNTGQLIICSHGTTGYSHTIKNMSEDDENTILYLSNIPSGFIATNSGIKERHDKYKNIITSSAEYFNKKNKDKKKGIIIKTVSYGNLLGAMVAKTLAEQGYTINQLDLMEIANGYYFFQSADDIANAILANEPEKISNIKKINTASHGSIVHPVKNSEYLADKLTTQLQQLQAKTEVNKASNTIMTNSTYDGGFKNSRYDDVKGKLNKFNKDEKMTECYEGGLKNGRYDDVKGKLNKFNKDGKITECYKGGFKNGQYDGKGKLIYYEDGKITVCHECGFKNGRRDGKGKTIYYDEDGNPSIFYTNPRNNMECVITPVVAKQKKVSNNNVSQHSKNNDINNGEIQNYNLHSMYINKIKKNSQNKN